MAKRPMWDAGASGRLVTPLPAGPVSGGPPASPTFDVSATLAEVWMISSAMRSPGFGPSSAL